MNPGPISIIRNTFPTHLHALLFSASFKSENIKTHLLSCIQLQNPKIPFTHHMYFIALLSTLFALSYLFYLHLHLVLDNHSMELGTQDEEVVLQVA
jgi:hypothetical protein